MRITHGQFTDNANEFSKKKILIQTGKKKIIANSHKIIKVLS